MKTFLNALLLSLLPIFSFAQSESSTLLYKIDGKEIAYPRLSNDSKKILYQSNQNGNWQLYIMDIKKGTHTAVMTDVYNNNFPDWSSDNQWIAFVSDRDKNEEIYIMKMDGSGLKRITQNTNRDIHPYFSPDGQYLLFNSTRSNGSLDIFRYTLATGEIKQLSATPQDETCARYSPDMDHIVYLQNDATSDDMIIADELNKQQKNISNTPMIRDGWPMFSYDGKWIFYSSMENGSYSIYKIQTDGTNKKQITKAKPEEEDARVSLSRDGKILIYNKRIGETIEIRKMKLS
jgi:TolB protein